jgi:L-arabinose isomerase
MTGAALYCETYAPEIDTGLVLIAAGGEGDPAWAAPPDAVRLEVNDHYPGERGEATSVAFGLRRGPATLLSLSPTRDGWVLAWAPGEVVETRYANMRGPNGMFRFDSGAGPDALSRWIVSGATHHNALAPGRLDVEVPALASALGIRTVRA